MLAIRDQENRIHGQQAAGAAKALQNAGKHGASKTAGVQLPKTPFKVPLNDENGARGLATGKSIFNKTARGNENLDLGGKGQGNGKDAFKTPLAARAPLGQKTTNAKARGFQTPAPSVPGNDLGKSRQQSASVRKKGPRISHAEPLRLNVLSDRELDDAFDIGIIHPRPKDLPDVPDDLPDIDLSLLKHGNFAQMAMHKLLFEPGPDGMSRAQKQKINEARQMELIEARDEAMMKRNIELHALPACLHEPECEGNECKDEPERCRKIEEEYQRTIEAVDAKFRASESVQKEQKPSTKPRRVERSIKSTIIPPKTGKPLQKANSTSMGPSSSLSKAAASALSTNPPVRARPAKLAPAATIASRKVLPTSTGKTQGSVSSTENLSRHASARIASNSTMGYAKSRAVSGAKRPSILPRSDMDVYQAPAKLLTDGRNTETPDWGAENDELCRMLIEDALDDFQLDLPED